MNNWVQIRNIWMWWIFSSNYCWTEKFRLILKHFIENVIGSMISLTGLEIINKISFEHFLLNFTVTCYNANYPVTIILYKKCMLEKLQKKSYTFPRIKFYKIHIKMYRYSGLIKNKKWYNASFNNFHHLNNYQQS